MSKSAVVTSDRGVTAERPRVFVIRRPGWHQRYVLEAHRLDFERTGDLEADTRAMLTAYHAIREEAIMSAPDQYS